MKKKRIGLFPGSFDPFTKGHHDIVVRSLSIVDEIIIGIGHNDAKKRYFEIEMMVNKIEKTFAHDPRVSVKIYNELTATFAIKHDITCIIRGLRNTTDFEYENTIAMVNKYLSEDLETILLITNPSLAYISSSIVRELDRFGADVSAFLPYSITE